MNTLSDTLCTREDLGFSLPSSSISINHLLYADDTCVIGNTPAACQHVLGMVERWLDWSHLRANVPKCHSLGIQSSTGRMMNPDLSSAGEIIPPVNDDRFKFLEMPVRVYNSKTSAKTHSRRSWRWADRVRPNHFLRYLVANNCKFLSSHVIVKFSTKIAVGKYHVWNVEVSGV